VHCESYLRTDGGETIPVQLAFNRLPAEDARMFVVVTDLTARERAEQREIERRMAEEDKFARDHFLAVVSHELRTPRNAVLGWAQVLRRRDDLPQAVERGLDVIVRNAWAQAQLIEDLLDVSRILAGRLRLDLGPTDLYGVIRAAIASVQPAAEANGIEILTDLSQAPIEVRGDIDRLQQIVWNLLSNTVKFSLEGGHVHVSLRDEAGYAEVQVRDARVGIHAAFLPHLFEVYQQRESATTRRTGGLGLGLAIVKQLTELHGGEVHADCAGEYQGATFTVRFPAVTDTVEVESDDGHAANIHAVRGLRLLVVEDEDDARESLVQILSSAGADVVTTSTAQEALHCLLRDRVGLLICDIGLPGMDGYELIRRVRASGRTGRELPAIAITAFAGRQDRRQALIAGYQVQTSPSRSTKQSATPSWRASWATGATPARRLPKAPASAARLGNRSRQPLSATALGNQAWRADLARPHGARRLDRAPRTATTLRRVLESGGAASGAGFAGDDGEQDSPARLAPPLAGRLCAPHPCTRRRKP
jgi:signal transduction histidine kinase